MSSMAASWSRASRTFRRMFAGELSRCKALASLFNAARLVISPDSRVSGSKIALTAVLCIDLCSGRMAASLPWMVSPDGSSTFLMRSYTAPAVSRYFASRRLYSWNSARGIGCLEASGTNCVDLETNSASLFLYAANCFAVYCVCALVSRRGSNSVPETSAPYVCLIREIFRVAARRNRVISRRCSLRSLTSFCETTRGASQGDWLPCCLPTLPA